MHAGLPDRTVLILALKSATLEMLAPSLEPAARRVLPHNLSRCLQCSCVNAKAWDESMMHLREEAWAHHLFI